MTNWDGGEPRLTARWSFPNRLHDVSDVIRHEGNVVDTRFP